MTRRTRAITDMIRSRLIEPDACFVTRDGIPARVKEVVRTPISLKLDCEYVSLMKTKQKLRTIDGVVNQVSKFLEPGDFAARKLALEMKRARLTGGLTPSATIIDNMPASSFPPEAPDTRTAIKSLQTMMSEMMEHMIKLENRVYDGPEIEPDAKPATRHAS